MWSPRSAYAKFSGSVYKPIASVPRDPPLSERGFIEWLKRHAKWNGKNSRYFINRNQAEGESAGLHPVVLCEIHENGGLEIKKSYSGIRGVPGAKRDLWFKAGGGRRRFVLKK